MYLESFFLHTHWIFTLTMVESGEMEKSIRKEELAVARAAVHHQTIVQGDEGHQVAVQGCDMQQISESFVPLGPDRLSQILSSFATTGFQATNLAKAINQVNAMRSWRPPLPFHDPDLSTINNAHKETLVVDPERSFCKIFLGYTSNMVSCGNREVIRYLVQHRMVHVLVTTAGGVEEDLIKCLKPTIMGDFGLEGRKLRAQGLNRIGNLLIPNENYCAFEDWLMPILDTMVAEQNTEYDKNNHHHCRRWTPSKLIDRLGKEINDERSIYYWAHVNGIPVYCPGITDGSLGDMIYFHSYRAASPDQQLILDLVEDIRGINNEALRAGCTGIICLGGGLVKHHICNANLMRNGAEYAVFINTGQEFDGSDSGASPDEAISWGKIKVTADPVKVCCDASIALPLLVAETFAKDPVDQRATNCHTLSAHLYM